MVDGHDGGGDSDGFDHSGHAGHGGGAFGSAGDIGEVTHEIGSNPAGHSMEHGHGIGPGGHGHGHGHGWGYGFIGHALHCMGMADGCSAETLKHGGRQVKLPGLLIGKRGFQVLVFPHGTYDIQKLVRRLAPKAGLKTLAGRIRTPQPSTKVESKLLDSVEFDGPHKQTPQPTGWFPGATGHTLTFSEYWQVPVCKHWFWPFPDIDLGPPKPAYLVIRGYTWYFNETGDFESRVAITVVSPTKWDKTKWTEDQAAFERNLKAGEKLARMLFSEVARSAKPTARSIQLRQDQAMREAIEAKFQALGVHSQGKGGEPGPGLQGLNPGPGGLSATKGGGDQAMRFDMGGR